MRFGDLVAVRDLSFEVKQGEILGIAGRNGAGKTTLFNAITGFYRYSGDVYLNGQKKLVGLNRIKFARRGLLELSRSLSFSLPCL